MEFVQRFLILLSLTVYYSQGIETGNNEHPPEIENPEVWAAEAKKAIGDKLTLKKIESKAKNLILMIGDGMGVSTLTASRIFKGQRSGKFGEEEKLYMETFPYVGTSKTFCSDTQVADSACSSTAYSTGFKANVKTLGVTPTVQYQNCTQSMNEINHVTSVLQWAQSRGMSTGLVTTSPVTDASPAGLYAHSADRDWENDRKVQESGYDPITCWDIAYQLVHKIPGKGINVVLGGGWSHFWPETVPYPDLSETSERFGLRRDGRNLTEDWVRNRVNAKYISRKPDLLEIDPTKTDFLLGLFSYTDMAFLDGRSKVDEPSLLEMTRVAIDILKRNPNGFYLFVEGGNIDTAHHVNQAQRALAETLEFDEAVQLVDSLTADEETLIVVSADHSHLLSIAGTPPRGNSIFGFTNKTDAGDGLPATTLTYVNGPGYRQPAPGTLCGRLNISKDDVENIEYRQMSLYNKSSATHAGEDVLIFAKGPFAHLFTGVNDQTFIAHAMQYAASVDGVRGAAAALGKLTWTTMIVCAITSFF